MKIHIESEVKLTALKAFSSLEPNALVDNGRSCQLGLGDQDRQVVRGHRVVRDYLGFLHHQPGLGCLDFHRDLVHRVVLRDLVLLVCLVVRRDLVDRALYL